MAGAVLVLSTTSCVVALTIGLVSVGAAATTSQRAAAAADSAALAAAYAASGIVAGDPCVRAVEVAAAVGAHVAQCRLDGLVATVEVSIPFGAFAATATARAGPGS